MYLNGIFCRYLIETVGYKIVTPRHKIVRERVLVGPLHAHRTDITDDVRLGPSAERDRRIYILAGSHVPIPGPRFVEVLEDFARRLHPEVDWSAP